MKFSKLKDSYEAYTQYRKIGAMSGAYVYSDENSMTSYLNDIFETLVIRDIVQKFKIRNTPLLEKKLKSGQSIIFCIPGINFSMIFCISDVN